MAEHRAYVGVGSNVHPHENIPRALAMLSEQARIEAISPFYGSAALARPGDPPFLNGVVRVVTALEARALKFDVLRGIEAALGRTRTDDAYAPRTIDLDILLFDDAIIDEPGLRVPDPDLERRAFLARPLLDLDPGVRIPGAGGALADAPCLAQPDRLTPEATFTDQLRERFRV
jgi:2-amino-4-hydroxy-6-hydroxymethyldihydropteridine diphosphokinase